MSNLNQAISQITGELRRVRARLEAPLNQMRGALKTKQAEVERLKPDQSQSTGNGLDTTLNLDAILAFVSINLQKVFRDYQAALRAEEAYRMHHGLTRPPMTPQKLESILFLTIMACIEIAIGASFFQNAAMVASFTAALLTSFLLSITNITLCACAGYFIGKWRTYGSNATDRNAPEFRHRRDWARIQFIGFIGVMAFFLSTLGMIRSQASLESVSFSMDSYALLLITPEAVFLVLIAGTMSVLSFHKGMHAFSDPYGDYGDYHAAVLAAREEVYSALENATDDIENAFDAALEEAETKDKTQSKAIDDYSKAVNDDITAHRNLEQAVASAESEMHSTLAQLVSVHAVASGKGQTLPQDVLAQLCCFDSFQVMDMPAYLQPPDNSHHKAKLLAEKAEVLKRLKELFKTFIDPEQEDER